MHLNCYSLILFLENSFNHAACLLEFVTEDKQTMKSVPFKEYLQKPAPYY